MHTGPNINSSLEVPFCFKNLKVPSKTNLPFLNYEKSPPCVMIGLRSSFHCLGEGDELGREGKDPHQGDRKYKHHFVAFIRPMGSLSPLECI